MNYPNAHWFPTITPLPNVREPVERVVRGFITEFHVGYSSRSSEGGVDIKPAPQGRQQMKLGWGR